MGMLSGVVGLVVGVVATWMYMRGRSEGGPATGDQHERELKAILDEVRELRTEIDILKVNPTIGDAVKSALRYAEDQPDFDRSAYDVAVRPGRLPASAYDVAVRPGKLPGGDVQR
jgi:hypothetical protein